MNSFYLMILVITMGGFNNASAMCWVDARITEGDTPGSRQLLTDDTVSAGVCAARCRGTYTNNDSYGKYIKGLGYIDCRFSSAATGSNAKSKANAQMLFGQDLRAETNPTANCEIYLSTGAGPSVKQGLSFSDCQQQCNYYNDIGCKNKVKASQNPVSTCSYTIRGEATTVHKKVSGQWGCRK